MYQSVDAVVQELNEFGVHSGCKANILKTWCTPLGKKKSNSSLINYITGKYGEEFTQNSFTALGFCNDISISKIAHNNS